MLLICIGTHMHYLQFQLQYSVTFFILQHASHILHILIFITEMYLLKCIMNLIDKYNIVYYKYI